MAWDKDFIKALQVDLAMKDTGALDLFLRLCGVTQQERENDE